MAIADLTQERLKELLHYDLETGVFTWLKKPRKRTKLTDKVGNLNPQGYVDIGIDGTAYKAHRLAWLYVTGHWPDNLLDHRDCDKSNNLFSNLREATPRQNGQNQKRAPNTSSTGIFGVTRKQGRWKAQIKNHGVNKHLGYFDSAGEAHEAYLAAKRKLHEFCTI